MAIYAYNKLDAQRREIRLCTLLPGPFDESLTCSLSIVSLDDQTEYESLSYAWGSRILDKELGIRASVHSNEQESPNHKPDNDAAAESRPAPHVILTVTTNLYTAFRYLRKSNQTRVVRAF